MLCHTFKDPYSGGRDYLHRRLSRVNDHELHGESANDVRIEDIEDLYFNLRNTKIYDCSNRDLNTDCYFCPSSDNCANPDFYRGSDFGPNTDITPSTDFSASHHLNRDPDIRPSRYLCSSPDIYHCRNVYRSADIDSNSGTIFELTYLHNFSVTSHHIIDFSNAIHKYFAAVY